MSKLTNFLIQIIILNLSLIQFASAQDLFPIESFFIPELISKNKIIEAKIEGAVRSPTKDLARQTSKGTRYIYFDKKGRIKSEHFVTDKGKDWTTGYYYDSDTLERIESSDYLGTVFKTEKYIYNRNLLDSIKIKSKITESTWNYIYDEHNELIQIDKKTIFHGKYIEKERSYYSSMHQLDSIQKRSGEFERISYLNDTIVVHKYTKEHRDLYIDNKIVLNNNKLPITSIAVQYKLNKDRNMLDNGRQFPAYYMKEYSYNLNGLIKSIDTLHKLIEPAEYRILPNNGIRITYISDD